MKRILALLAAAAGIGPTTATLAAVINVPGGQPTIQAAINAAMNGDEIVVGPGVYTEVIDFSNGGIPPQDKAITLRSSHGPANTFIDATGINSSVISCENGASQTTVIDGFTIRKGTGTVLGVAKRGGGMLAFMSSPLVRNCIFTMNSATGGDGGAVYAFFANPRFENCIFHANTAPEGGAIYSDMSNPRFDNCSIIANTATTGGGVYVNTGGSPLFLNSIIWHNTASSFGNSFAGPGTPIARYSDIQGGFLGEGNIATNPQLVNTTNNFRLQETSPCIDAGDSEAVASSIFDDIAGDPRGVDAPSAPDTGVPVFGLVVDMGAYEFQFESCGPSDCLGDVTGPTPGVPDGVVDALDLLALVATWGNCGAK